MITDQVERLAEEEAATPTARRLLDNLSVQVREDEPIKDLMAQDFAEAKSPVVRTVLTGLTWMVYAVAVVAVGLIVWSIAR